MTSNLRTVRIKYRDGELRGTMELGAALALARGSGGALWIGLPSGAWARCLIQ